MTKVMPILTERGKVRHCCTFGWWHSGPAPVPGRTWVLCVHFITGLSYNKPTKSFSPQRSSRIKDSSFNSRIAHGFSAIIALFHWLFQSLYLLHARRAAGSLSCPVSVPFQAGFPSTRHHNLYTWGGSGLFSTFYDLLVLLNFRILNVVQLL